MYTHAHALVYVWMDMDVYICVQRKRENKPTKHPLQLMASFLFYFYAESMTTSLKNNHNYFNHKFQREKWQGPPLYLTSGFFQP